MKGFVRENFLICLLVVTLLAPNARAQSEAKDVPAPSGQPLPLIDREFFFGNPEFIDPKLSPDGRMISFLRAYKGILNIWVKKTEDPFSKSYPITASEEPVNNSYWTLDSRLILFSHNTWENDIYNVFAVDPVDSVESPLGVPYVHNLYPSDSQSVKIIRASALDSDLLWVGSMNKDQPFDDLYKFRISTGSLTLIRKNADRISQIFFDWNEVPRIGIRYESKDSSLELLRLNKDGSSTKIYDCSNLDICKIIGFSADNQWVYIKTNKGEQQDLVKLIRLNPETMKWNDVEQDPLNKVDLGRVLLGDSTHDLLFTSYFDDNLRVYWKDSSYQQDELFLRSKFPDRQIAFQQSSTNEQRYLITISADDKLPQVYSFDRDTKSLILQYTEYSRLKPFENALSKIQPETYQSSDGMNIGAYLSMPKGYPSKNLPLIVMPHDGPWSRDYRGFNHIVQWLNSRGYAVLQMNYRGSSGFGKKFLNAGNRQWGLLMQDDITWGINDLIGRGIADPRRIAIMGNGYGGYAALAGLAFTSDIYTAAVAIDGPSNLITLIGSIPANWNKSKRIFAERVGDDSRHDGRIKLERTSPLFADSAIKSPLLMIQDRYRSRIAKIESDQLVIDLRDSGRKVEYLDISEESQNASRTSNQSVAFARAESFLGKNLHARYQESVRPDVARRLQEITVDIAALTPGIAKVFSPLQKFDAPGADLNQGSYTYGVMADLRNRRIPLNMTRTIVDDSLNWIVTDKITGQMGEQTDEAVYQKGSLIPVSRKTTQRNATNEYDYFGNDIRANLSGKTVNSSIEGAYLHDGAGIDMLIARMPLKEGFESAFNLVGDDGKPKLYQLKVLGMEKMNGANCYKVQLTNVDNTTINTLMWISPSQKMAYRIVVPLAALPGAKMTIDLLQQSSQAKFILFLWVATPAHLFE
ncbi:MAG: prolyl oligopeptidase family serine peptidase [Chitinophagales bacterium]